MFAELALIITMLSPKNDQHAKWKKFVQDITEKRMKKAVNTSGKQKINESSTSITNRKEITVHFLASEATGKAQKFLSEKAHKSL